MRKNITQLVAFLAGFSLSLILVLGNLGAWIYEKGCTDGYNDAVNLILNDVSSDMDIVRDYLLNKNNVTHEEALDAVNEWTDFK